MPDPELSELSELLQEQQKLHTARSYEIRGLARTLFECTMRDNLSPGMTTGKMTANAHQCIDAAEMFVMALSDRFPSSI